MKKSLKGMTFVLNPYDPCCIANCEIEGTQCTVAWYVDENTKFHMSTRTSSP